MHLPVFSVFILAHKASETNKTSLKVGTHDATSHEASRATVKLHRVSSPGMLREVE